jgi:uncharacterized membrane protein YkgB
MEREWVPFVEEASKELCGHIRLHLELVTNQNVIIFAYFAATKVLPDVEYERDRVDFIVLKSLLRTFVIQANKEYIGNFTTFLDFF